MLEALSERLGLTGGDRYAKAEEKAEAIQKERSALLKKYNERKKVFDGHRTAIRNALYGRWPGLANVLTEESVGLLTTDADAFVDAVTNHPRFGAWNEVEEEREQLSDERFDLELDWVQCVRFQRAHNNVVLAENLERLGQEDDIRRFEIIRELESGAMPSGGAAVSD